MIIYQTDLKDLSVGMLGGFFVGWPNPPSPTKHYELLEKSMYKVLAIDQEHNKVVGFITAISDGVLSAYIPFLEVHPEYQGQGIGSMLVQMMLDQLMDYYMIDLLCDPEIQPYYDKLGMLKATGMMKRNYHNQAGKD